jgi:MFS family permease
VLGLDELPPVMRRNLLYEAGYSACAGVVSGLAMLAQVTVIGSLGGGATAVMLITAAMPAASLTQPLWVELARRYRLKQMALISGALRCLPLLLIGWVADPWLFAILVVTFYVFAAPLSLAVPSLYKYTYADSHRGRIIGILRMVQNGSSMPAMLASAWLMDLEPELYQVIYPLGGVVGLVGLFFYQQLLIPTDSPHDRRRSSERPTWRGIREVLAKDDNFRLFQATIFLTGAGFLMTRPVYVFLLADQFRLGQFETALLVQVMPLLLGAATSPAWGAFIDRTSPVAGRIAFALLGLVAYVLMFASFAAGWLLLAYVAAIVRGLVLGAAELSMTTGNLYFSVHRERAALYEGIGSLLQGVRGLLMPVLGRLAFPFVGVSLFLLPAVLNVWSLWLSVILWRRDQAESPETALARRSMAEVHYRGESSEPDP